MEEENNENTQEQEQKQKSRFGDRTSSTCEHEWEYGNLILGTPYTPKKCKKCGLVR